MTRTVPGLRLFENVSVFFENNPAATAINTTAGVSFRGIFTAPSSEGDERGGPTVVCATADVLELVVEYGDMLTVDEVTYRVEAIRDDGTGVTELVLE